MVVQVSVMSVISGERVQQQYKSRGAPCSSQHKASVSKHPAGCRGEAVVDPPVDSTMLHGLSLRLSWICLLLFSSGACFPATKEEYQYPYTALGRSGGGPVSRPALVSLQSGAAASRAGSPTGNHSPSSLGAPSGAALSYEPRRFVSPASGSVKPPRVPEVPPSFSVQLQPGVGSSGNSRPFYRPSYAGAPATPSFAAGSSRYAAPAASGVGYGSSRYAAPAASGVGYGSSRYAAAPAASGVGYGSSRYVAAPASTDSVGAGGSAGAPSTFRFEGAAAAGSPSSSASLPWPEQSVAGFQASFYHPSSWMPSRSFPDLSVWDTELAAPQSMSETSPEALSSYIVQSSNGYLRAREVLSHNRYVPEYPEPPVYQAVKSAPKTAPKGGKI